MIRSIAFLLALTSSAGAQNTASAIARYIATFDTAGHLSGTVLAARGDSVEFERSYGSRDSRNPTPNSPTTLFAVASISKPLTGIVTRQLAERGVINLDDPIARWVPSFPNGDRITIAHLLGHRAGIPHRVTTLADEQQPQSAESMAQKISRVSLLFNPGERRLYSSAGYTLLAYVLERATGQPYAELLRQLVLAPAGATHAFDASEPANDHARAKGHFWTLAGPLAAPDKQLSFLVGAGSLWATPRDLFKIVRRIVSGGFSVAATAGARTNEGVIQWTGFSNGFQAIVAYDPASEVTVIVTSNLLTGAAEALVRDVPRVMRGEVLPVPNIPRHNAVALSAGQRKLIEGAYNFGGNDQQLSFVRPSVAILGGEYAIISTSDTTFFAPQNYASLRVVKGADGRVAALEFVGQGGFSMPRVR